jgi:hypothetical protein
MSAWATSYNVCMKTARFWTRAEAIAPDENDEPIRAQARGWSNESLDAAREKALELALRVAKRIANGDNRAERYPYGDRPLPEPVIREFNGAMVTRNRYGALVLNTDQMMFVDVDRKASPPKSGGIFSSLFGKPKPAPAPVRDPTIDELAEITSRHNLGARLYETAAGYRLLITSARFRAGSPEAEMLLAAYKSDPLYIRLCRMQESFRARLTPKPWRCDHGKAYPQFPFEDARQLAAAERWESEYGSKSAPFATCRFVEEVGAGGGDPGFQELIEFHDEQTRAGRVAPLA